MELKFVVACKGIIITIICYCQIVINEQECALLPSEQMYTEPTTVQLNGSACLQMNFRFYGTDRFG